MADGAAFEGEGATLQVVGEILAIPLPMIEVRDRLRPIDPVFTEALSVLMAKDGQETPIEVCRLPGRGTLRLVTGGHRLAAAGLLGWATIRGVVVSADALSRRKKEIAENLWRSDLNPIDRASFVAELVELERTAAGISPDATPQALAASARWSKSIKNQATDANDIVSRAYGFSADVAERLNLSVRSIQRDLELHRGLAPDVVARIRGLPLASNAGQLRALAKMTEADQRAAMDLMVEGKARNPGDALGILRQKPKPDMAKKAWSAFVGGWGRMTARQRRDALQELVRLGLPAGVAISFEDVR